MTELLEKALATARNLPQDMQDEIARMVLLLAGEDQPIVELTSKEEAWFTMSLAQADKREFVADEQVQAVWLKHGL